MNDKPANHYPNRRCEKGSAVWAELSLLRNARGPLARDQLLAVPVIARTGEVYGGLFFGHPETDVFTERSVRIVEGLAGQVAIAMENARSYEATQSARDEAEQVAEEKERMRQEQSGPSSLTLTILSC